MQTLLFVIKYLSTNSFSTTYVLLVGTHFVVVLSCLNETMLFASILTVAVIFVESSKVPIIGVLTQEVPPAYTKYGHSYIAASYVKFVETAGGKVVPVFIGRHPEYYKSIVESTNGLLFPGGDADLDAEGGYGEAGRILLSFAVEANRRGIHYPIFGTCLGMELLAVLLGGTKALCSAVNMPLPLYFTNETNTSKLYGEAPQEMISTLQYEPIAFNTHRNCVLANPPEPQHSFRILSINYDTHGLEFVSSFESSEYPIYGLQFHPEKTQFEFNDRLRIPHSLHAVRMAQYFANFFLEEARKNSNAFKSEGEEKQSLIYNYCPAYTGKYDSPFEQMYFFPAQNFLYNAAAF